MGSDRLTPLKKKKKELLIPSPPPITPFSSSAVVSAINPSLLVGALFCHLLSNFLQSFRAFSSSVQIFGSKRVEQGQRKD